MRHKLIAITIVLNFLLNLTINANAFQNAQKACDEGDAQKCFKLAVAYDVGSIKRDAKKAHALYRKACYGGHAVACFNLASIYADDPKVE